MIERIYKCDLCGDRKEMSQLVGIYWGASGKIEQKSTPSTEHHLCIDCVRGVQEMGKK